MPATWAETAILWGLRTPRWAKAGLDRYSRTYPASWQAEMSNSGASLDSCFSASTEATAFWSMTSAVLHLPTAIAKAVAVKTGILGRSRSAVSGRNRFYSGHFDANGFGALSSLLSRQRASGQSIDELLVLRRPDEAHQRRPLFEEIGLVRAARGGDRLAHLEDDVAAA
jgi:hypothetical protein